METTTINIIPNLKMWRYLPFRCKITNFDFDSPLTDEIQTFQIPKKEQFMEIKIKMLWIFKRIFRFRLAEASKIDFTIRMSQNCMINLIQFAMILFVASVLIYKNSFIPLNIILSTFLLFERTISQLTIEKFEINDNNEIGNQIFT